MKCTEVKVHSSSKEPEKVLLPINRVCSERGCVPAFVRHGVDISGLQANECLGILCFLIYVLLTQLLILPWPYFSLPL